MICDTLDRARIALKDGVSDAILLGVHLPDGKGIDLLRELKHFGKMRVVIIMTAYATLENAISALKEGAVDYFTNCWISIS